MSPLCSFVKQIWHLPISLDQQLHKVVQVSNTGMCLQHCPELWSFLWLRKDSPALLCLSFGQALQTEEQGKALWKIITVWNSVSNSTYMHRSIAAIDAQIEKLAQQTGQQLRPWYLFPLDDGHLLWPQWYAGTWLIWKPTWLCHQPGPYPWTAQYIFRLGWITIF